MARGLKVKVNMNSIIKKVKVSKGTIRQLEKKAKKDLKIASKAYMDAFESHPITKELSAGIHASNTSGTLGGYGNLRTFMGFSSNPIPTLREILRSAFSVKKSTVSRKNNGLRTFTFSFPSKTYIEGKTSQLNLEFEPSRNWVLALERGISGFSNYMYKKFAGGKSGKGVQIKGTIDRGISSFKPTPYRTEFEKAFRNKINNNFK